MDRCGTNLPDNCVQRKPSHGENFTYLDDNVPNEKQLHLPSRRDHMLETTSGLFFFFFLLCSRLAYLRPTAAFFLSVLHSKTKVTKIDIKASRMDPKIVSASIALASYAVMQRFFVLPRFRRCLPLLRSMPRSSQPPYAVHGDLLPGTRS